MHEPELALGVVEFFTLIVCSWDLFVVLVTCI